MRMLRPIAVLRRGVRWRDGPSVLDCCRTSGVRGRGRLLSAARAALDTLVRPALWPATGGDHEGHSADRRWGYCCRSTGSPWRPCPAVVGAATSWWAMVAGWAHGDRFFAWVARRTAPHPATAWAGAIRTGGSNHPLLQRRRGERVLFFFCEEDPSEEAGRRVHGARPAEGHRRLRALLRLPPRHPAGVAPWRVPVNDLQFEKP